MGFTFFVERFIELIVQLYNCNTVENPTLTKPPKLSPDLRLRRNFDISDIQKIGEQKLFILHKAKTNAIQTQEDFLSLAVWKSAMKQSKRFFFKYIDDVDSFVANNFYYTMIDLALLDINPPEEFCGCNVIKIQIPSFPNKLDFLVDLWLHFTPCPTNSDNFQLSDGTLRDRGKAGYNTEQLNMHGFKYYILA